MPKPKDTSLGSSGYKTEFYERSGDRPDIIVPKEETWKKQRGVSGPIQELKESKYNPATAMRQINDELDAYDRNMSAVKKRAGELILESESKKKPVASSRKTSNSKTVKPAPKTVGSMLRGQMMKQQGKK